MPRKPKKSKEEKTVEGFFPVDSDDVRHAIEKPYKSPSAQVLIDVKESGKKPKKIYKRKLKKTIKKTKKRVSSKKAKAKEFKTPKIKLKKEGYELIITEKPQAALKISSALGKSVKRNIGNVPYYEVDRKGKKIVVACAVGHLFTLAEKPGTRNKGPAFDIMWVPNSFVRKSDFSKKYYDVLSKLVKDASSLIVATDYDIEGEVIGLNVIRFIAGQEDASRMKFSTLTDKELNQAYETKQGNIDWGQAIAGETRHFLDWLYGINISRALMNAIKSTGRFRVFSIGRVQGPSLNLIVKKEKQILAFKPRKYWQVFITLENPKIELIHNKDLFDKSKLKVFEDLIGQKGKAETKKTEQKLSPGAPFNLTTLQTEAYRLYGVNPSKTLQIAQSLYLSGLISYPRTSSQRLPPSIGYKEILEKLSKIYKVESLIKREKPIEGKKSDPAHPSIYPTGQNPSGLSKEEGNLYELIVRRFLALFCEDAIVENKTIKVIAKGLDFVKKGSSIKKKSWLSFYPKKVKEEELEDVEGDVTIEKTRTEEKETQPPKRYTPASLVSELEKRNLGTKATRSSILETLYNRGYVKGQSIQSTPLGISLIDTLEKHSPIIIDENLTHIFESEMESIQKAKSGQKEKEEKIIEKAKENLISISNQFSKQQAQIGKELLGAQDKLIEQEREENKLNICPLCKKGNLQIRYSRKTRRSFVGCSSYPECKNTYSLPPNGLIKKANKICESCGFPMVMRISKGKRPWIFCFNPNCQTNKERLEAYKQKQNKP